MQTKNMEQQQWEPNSICKVIVAQINQLNISENVLNIAGLESGTTYLPHRNSFVQPIG